MFKRKPKRYYREYLSQWGWGVMVAYDTVTAKSKKEASKFPKRQPYCDSFELITKVKKEHLELSDEKLSELYGERSEK